MDASASPRPQPAAKTRPRMPVTAQAAAAAADLRAWIRIPDNALLAFIVALLVAHVLLIVFPLHAVSLWSGEASFHLDLQMQAIAAISQAETWPEVARGLLHIFHRFPKILYDATGVGAGLLAGTGGSLRSHTMLMAAIQAACFLGLLWISWRYLRRWFGPLAAGIGLLFVVTDQYFQVYAVFPRQNVAANMLGFLILFAYLGHRRQAATLAPGPALGLGIGIGIAVMTHYSAAELVLMVLACELVLSLADRRFVPNAIGFAILLAGMAGSILGADLVYYALKRSAEGAGTLPASFPVLDGLLHTVARIYVDGAPREKVMPGSPAFPLGYLFAVMNPVLVPMTALGLLAALAARGRAALVRTFRDDRLLLLALVLVVLYLAAGSRFFSAARALVFYMPAFLVLACFVVATVQQRASEFGLELRELRIITVLLALVVVAVPASRTLETRAAVRAGSHIDAALRRQELQGRPLFQVGSIPDYGLRAAVTPVAPEKACAVRENALLYVFRSVPVPRGYGPPAAQAAIEALRRQEPLAKVRGYQGLALYHYEFPLFPEWLDPGDWLTTHHALFDAAVFREAVCRGSG